MSTEIDILIKLKTQLITFFDELVETFPTEPEFLIFRVFIDNRIPIVDVMNYIIVKLVPLRDMVKRKDSAFFLGHNILFDQLDSTKVNHFKRIWLSKNIDDDDKDVIWAWFNSFIDLGVQFQALKK